MDFVTQEVADSNASALEDAEVEAVPSAVAKNRASLVRSVAPTLQVT